MLEYNLNTLDNDFITLWSKYILTSDTSYIIKDLEKLAELGQINAVQSWYLFKEIGDNEKIDSIVKSYKLGNYNELFAIANYLSKTTEVIQEYVKLYDNCEYWESKYREFSGYYDEEAIQQLQKCEKKVNLLIKKLRELPNIQKYLMAIRHASEQAKLTNSYVILQRVSEMLCSLASETFLVEDQKLYLKKAKIANVHATKELFKQYRKILKKNGKIDINENPIFYFSLAKSVVLFDKKAKLKNIGLGILREFSEREYSKELQESINKDKSNGQVNENYNNFDNDSDLSM